MFNDYRIQIRTLTSCWCIVSTAMACTSTDLIDGWLRRHFFWESHEQAKIDIRKAGSHIYITPHPILCQRIDNGRCYYRISRYFSYPRLVQAQVQRRKKVKYLFTYSDSAGNRKLYNFPSWPETYQVRISKFQIIFFFLILSIRAR